MHVVVTSIVRDGAGYLGRYFGQVRGLRASLEDRGDTLAVALGEGDSRDASWPLMMEFAESIGDGSMLVDVSHGGQAFGSVDHPSRWAQIARCWNRLYDAMAPATVFDAVLYVEADLVWATETMVRLLDHLAEVPAVSPMSFHRNGFFYDTWGHRGVDGSRFGPFAPYHPCLQGIEQGLVKIGSAGSCMAMRAEVAQRCRFKALDAMLGHAIYEAGFSLWLDPSLRVTHP